MIKNMTRKTPARHEALLLLPDDLLLKLAPDATHQHYKGGLYRLNGPTTCASDGVAQEERIWNRDISYTHLCPHAVQDFHRNPYEFYGGVTVTEAHDIARFGVMRSGSSVKRFRQLHREDLEQEISNMRAPSIDKFEGIRLHKSRIAIIRHAVTGWDYDHPYEIDRREAYRKTGFTGIMP